jgi:hypothetical protein
VTGSIRDDYNEGRRTSWNVPSNVDHRSSSRPPSPLPLLSFSPSVHCPTWAVWLCCVAAPPCKTLAKLPCSRSELLSHALVALPCSAHPLRPPDLALASPVVIRTYPNTNAPRGMSPLAGSKRVRSIDPDQGLPYGDEEVSSTAPESRKEKPRDWRSAFLDEDDKEDRKRRDRRREEDRDRYPHQSSSTRDRSRSRDRDSRGGGRDRDRRGVSRDAPDSRE